MWSGWVRVAWDFDFDFDLNFVLSKRENAPWWCLHWKNGMGGGGGAIMLCKVEGMFVC
jgi:hypothetical protein